MEKKMKQVLVSASFEKGPSLFDWLKKYAQSADERFLYWDEFSFSVNPIPESDAVLVFNNPSASISIRCFPETTIAFMMEPGIPAEHPWMFKGLQQYARVYSPIDYSLNTVLSPGFLGWHLQKDHAWLSALQIPEKQAAVSCIASTLSKLAGHRRRLQFVTTLQKEIPGIDFFGRGFRFIPDKTDALLPYRYSVAIENGAAPFYFTEKITDCFLTYTVPLYYGCTNIGRFFPEKSFVHIDIENPQKSIRTIRELIEKDDWQERACALQEARELVLNKYQPLAAAATILRQTKPSQKIPLTLKPVPESFSRRLKNSLLNLATKK